MKICSSFAPYYLEGILKIDFVQDFQKNIKRISEFFFEYFSYDKAESLIAWYRGFNRMDWKVELLDLVPKVDTTEVIKHLDNELLNKIPEKLIGR